MDKQVIKDLIEIMDEAKLTALRVDDGTVKVELERNQRGIDTAALPGIAEHVEELLSGKTRSHENASVPDDTEEDDGTVIVRSPMVGMFYTAPSPDEEPFVKPGQEVISGQTLAIIEAMKMMNELTATASGVVTNVLAANGTQVEYDQPLFRIAVAQDAR